MPGRTQRVISDFCLDADSSRPPFDHTVNIGVCHGVCPARAPSPYMNDNVLIIPFKQNLWNMFSWTASVTPIDA